jgi:hypothetical protein
MRIQLAEIEIVDKDLLEMINYMDNYYSNNTVFIILEDHGSRYGLYRQTLQGKLEERLPALFILVPPKLLENFPYIKKNLEINRKRLVTAFDLHETILSIFKLGQTDLIFPKKDNHGISLFDFEISKNRTCIDVDIELHWCTCLQLDNISISNQMVQYLAQYLIDKINEETGNGEGVCAKLFIEKIENSQIQNLGEKMRTFNIEANNEKDR